MSVVTEGWLRAREVRLENIKRFGEYYVACPFCEHRRIICARCFGTGRMAQGSVDKLKRDGEL